MAISVTHATVATSADDPSKEINKGEWNAAHSISMATSRVLGRTTSGTGAVEELKGMWVEVSRATASNSATIDFTGIDSTSDEWLILATRLSTTTDGDYLYIRTSSNGGSSYDNGVSDYTYQSLRATSSTVSASRSTNNEVVMNAAASQGNATGEFMSAKVKLMAPSAGDMQGFVESAYKDTSGNFIIEATRFTRHSASAVNAVRVFAQTGNLNGELVLLKRLK
jgi:hypothetical protein